MNEFILGLIVIVYLLSLVFLGYVGYKKTTSTSDYLVGGRDMNPFVMSLSYGATFISASAIVGFGGVAAAFGMGIQWLCFLNMFVGVIIAFIFFGLKTRKIGAELGAGTFAQFLGKYYHSRAIQIFVGVVIFITMPLYAAVVMKGGSVFMEEIFHIDYNMALLIFTLIIAAYVIAGGIKGVMYTDALQAIIMFICMLILLFSIYKIIGMNFTEANIALTNLSSEIPEKYRVLGHQGWTSMPVMGSPQWYTLVTSLILGVGIGCLAQPQLVVRFMTVKSGKELKRGVFVGCLFILITVGTIYHTGALSNLYFMKTQGHVATDIIKDIDKIIPYFIDKAMPSWFSALFMLCILSASMSTLSSQFHTMGSALGQDVYGVYKKRTDLNHKLIIRLGVLVSILFSYIICYMLPDSIIARATSIFMGLCAIVFLPAYFCALYWKKATSEGVMWSMSLGTFSTIFCMLFLHAKEAEAFGICNAFFGKSVLFDSDIKFVDPILFALPVSCITIVVVSLLTQKKKLVLSE